MDLNDPVGIVLLRLGQLWAINHNSPWLISTIKLQRNIEKFKFPVKLELERKRQIVNLAGKEFVALEQLKDPILLKAEELSFLEKEYLAEHFLSIDSFHQASTGEAFALENSGLMLLQFNGSDHLNFFTIDTQGDIEGAWSRLVRVETGLGKSLNYAYSQKFGFLTADLGKCGTALTATAFLQLPGLIHTDRVDAILDECVDDSFSVTGIQGDPNDLVGDMLLLQNNYCLGVTEESILSSLRLVASKLISEENDARKKIAQSRDTAIMDTVSRAFAILLYSYQIEVSEALNALSILKLGVEIGWVGGITSDTLNNLFFNSQRAHLLRQYPGKISHTDVPHKRAEFIHQALKEAKLLI